MATSGTYVYSPGLNELAEESFDLIQIGQDGESLSGDMIARYKTSANLLLKEWQNQGLHLWAQTEGTLFPSVGTSEYDLDTAKVANTWYETTTTADTAALDTSFTVTSASNITAGDTIGIIQSDNDIFWTTVASVVSTTVTVDDSIPLATSSGAYVRNYNAAFKPISRVMNVRRKDESYEIPILFESRENYFNLPNKDTTGTVIQAYYSRHDVAGENNGTMYLWETPSSSVPVVNFTYERKLQILSGSTDTLDLPEYAQNAFVYTMATRMIPKYGCSAERTAFLMAQADRFVDDMLDFDSTSYPVRVKIKHG